MTLRINRATSAPDTVTSFRDLGPAVGSAASATAAGASWITGDQFLTAVLAALAGSLLTVYFTGQQQKKSWQRDVAIQMTGALYGPLYVDVWEAMQAFALDFSQPIQRRGYYRSEIWPQIQRDYRYRVIPKALRDRLDTFYSMVAKATETSSKVVDVSNRIFLDAQRELLDPTIERSTWTAHGVIEETITMSLPFFPDIDLAQGVNVIKHLHMTYPNVMRFYFSVEKGSKDSKSTINLTEQEADKIFQAAEKRLRSDQTYIAHENLEHQILRDGESLRETLGLIVEEPWKI